MDSSSPFFSSSFNRGVLTTLACASACWAVSQVGCAHARHRSLPTSSRLIVDRLVVNSDVELVQQDVVLQELVQLRSRMSEELGLQESSEPIYIYLFSGKKEFDGYAERWYPQLVGRRAYFVESAAGLNVFSRWGPRVAEDLRHEVAHGYLHAVADTIPLWLDEGIAEVFEVRPDDQGLNWPHVERLSAARRRGSWQPDLPRLESLTEAEQMLQIDYAESWLWIHFLLHTNASRSALLKGYIAELQENRVAMTFAERIGDAESALLQHLELLADGLE